MADNKLKNNPKETQEQKAARIAKEAAEKVAAETAAREKRDKEATEKAMAESRKKVQTNLDKIQKNMATATDVAESMKDEIAAAKEAKEKEEAENQKPHPDSKVGGIPMARKEDGSLNGRNGPPEEADDDPIVAGVKNSMNFSLWTWPTTWKPNLANWSPKINVNSIGARLIPAGVIAIALFLVLQVQLKSSLRALSATMQEQMDEEIDRLQNDFNERMIVKDSVILSQKDIIAQDSAVISDQIGIIDNLEEENYQLQVDLNASQSQVRDANRQTREATQTLQNFQRDYQVISEMNETLQESLITHKVNTYRLERILAQEDQKQIIEANGMFVEVSLQISNDSLIVVPTRAGYDRQTLTSR
jgi:membrane-associated HD superfamily phosphohydrolase